MKILALIGSGRKNGNTAGVVSLLETALVNMAEEQHAPLEFKTVFLSDLRLKQCLGCRVCFDRGIEHCPLDDGLMGLYEEILQADFLLLASPVYVEDVSGIMKTFIDRLAFVCHRPAFAETMGAALMTYGATATNHTLRTMTLAMRTWGIHVVGQQGFFGGARLNPVELHQLHHRKIDKMAKIIFGALQKKAYKKPDFLSLMMFATQQATWMKTTEEDLDLAYWRQQGWLEPRVTYYFPPQTGPMKTAAARLVGKAIAMLVQ